MIPFLYEAKINPKKMDHVQSKFQATATILRDMGVTPLHHLCVKTTLILNNCPTSVALWLNNEIELPCSLVLPFELGKLFQFASQPKHCHHPILGAYSMYYESCVLPGGYSCKLELACLQSMVLSPLLQVAWLSLSQLCSMYGYAW